MCGVWLQRQLCVLCLWVVGREWRAADRGLAVCVGGKVGDCVLVSSELGAGQGWGPQACLGVCVCVKV